MAPFGKIYAGSKTGGRTRALFAVAKANDLEVELVETQAGSTDSAYLQINPLGKVPSFVGADGFTLTETMAIAVYLASQNEKTTLLGKSKQDYALILKWASFTVSEMIPLGYKSYLPLIGVYAYNKKEVETAQETLRKFLKVVEARLLENTYLVGERLTLADLVVSSALSWALENFLDKKWRDANPATVRWFETVANQPAWKEVYEVKYCETAPANKPPAKPKAEKVEKAAKPKKVEEPAEEDKPVPKPKHPLEELPRATFVLDDWKRKYSNDDTRSVALPWFWENVNFEEYSLWQVDYKYNDELTQTFMTSNLIGGFFTRLEASRKYIFGSCSVFGVANDSIVRGAFLIRGNDAPAAFDVAPDWESYQFTKLDPAKDKAFVEDMWSWDKPIEANGKTYDWADGKVFK